jgi:hypothetical protein
MIVETKGYKSGKYKWMTVGLWFGGEIIGAIITGGDESLTCLLYIIALLGAAAGAAIANSIANRLEPLPGYPKLPETANQTDSDPKIQEQKKMSDNGLITSEEYEAKKEEVLPRRSQEMAPKEQVRTNVKKKNSLSIASMILGIVSIPLSLLFGVGVLFGIAAVIMGYVARKQIKESGGMQEGDGMALAGIIIGGFVIVLSICVLIIAILMLMGPIIGDVFSTINSSLSAP